MRSSVGSSKIFHQFCRRKRGILRGVIVSRRRQLNVRPGTGGAGGLTKGIFLDYGLNLTAGGLQGTYNPLTGPVESTNHPTAVDGVFWAIFQNTNTVDPSLNGYYVANFALGLDNWAYGQGATLNGELAPSEFGAPVPIPAAVWLLGSGVVGLVALRRRRQK